VNGQVVRELGTSVDPRRDEVTCDGTRVVLEDRVWILLNKPDKTVSTVDDPEGRPTVIDLVGNQGVRLYPVGRLDYHTEGVLLLTNDGDLANSLMHPRNKIQRVYQVKLRGMVEPTDLDRLRNGVTLDDGKQVAAPVHILGTTEKHTWIEMTLTQGLNRQVHRMIDAIGGVVLRLIRVSYAGLTAEGLKPGHYRALTQSEVDALRTAAKLKRETVRAEATVPGRRTRGTLDRKPRPVREPPAEERQAGRRSRRKDGAAHWGRLPRERAAERREGRGERAAEKREGRGSSRNQPREGRSSRDQPREGERVRSQRQQREDRSSRDQPRDDRASRDKPPREGERVRSQRQQREDRERQPREDRASRDKPPREGERVRSQRQQREDRSSRNKPREDRERQPRREQRDDARGQGQQRGQQQRDDARGQGQQRGQQQRDDARGQGQQRGHREQRDDARGQRGQREQRDDARGQRGQREQRDDARGQRRQRDQRDDQKPPRQQRDRDDRQREDRPETAPPEPPKTWYGKVSRGKRR